MRIYKSKWRGRPVYRWCGQEVISYVAERVTWEIRLARTRVALLRVVQRAVYVIDGRGVRRATLGTRVEAGHKRRSL